MGYIHWWALHNYLKLMKAQQKSGLFGMKTELVPTDKGFKEYYS